MYLVFISIISQQHLILVTCPIAPANRNSLSLVNFMTKMVNLHFSILIVGIYMGILLVKFVSHIFWIHDQHSHKPTSFHKKNYTKTASLTNVFLMVDSSVPSVLWFLILSLEEIWKKCVVGLFFFVEIKSNFNFNMAET